MFRHEQYKVLPTSALTDVERAVIQIDSLNYSDIEIHLSYLYNTQLEWEAGILNQAAETLAEALDKEEFSSEACAIISDHINIATMLLKEYDKAWQLLRYGHYVEQEY